MIFTLVHRKYLDTWLTSTGSTVRYAKRVGTYPLVCRYVWYKLEGYHVAPVRVEPWSMALHKYFFLEQTPYHAEPNDYPPPHPLEFLSYLKCLNQRLDALVIGRGPDAFNLVKNKQWVELLKKYPGRVDPCVLFSYGVPPDDVRLAKVLYEIHLLMKKHRVVWLEESLLVSILSREHFRETIKRAFVEGYLVQTNIDDKLHIAMRWAAGKLPENPPHLVHKSDTNNYCSVDKWDKKATEFDFKRSPAPFLDRGLLPMTMTVPRMFFPLPELAELPFPLGKFAALRKSLELDLPTANKRVLLVAPELMTAGTLDPLSASLVRTLREFPPVKIHEVGILRFQSGGKYTLRVKNTEVTLSNNDAFESLVPASFALFEDLPSIKTKAYDTVVVMGNGVKREIVDEWTFELVRIVGKPSSVVLIIGYEKE